MEMWIRDELDRCPSVVYSPLGGLRISRDEKFVCSFCFASFIFRVALGIIFLRFEGGVGWVVDIEKGTGGL
jgi:hypothetical protein